MTIIKKKKKTMDIGVEGGKERGKSENNVLSCKHVRYALQSDNFERGYQ